MTDERNDGLPADVAAECTDDAERFALDEVWRALAEARPETEVASTERAAMWAGIVAGTTTGARVDASVAPSATPVVAPSAAERVVPGAMPVRRARRQGARPAWASRVTARRVAAALGALAVVVVGLGRPTPWQVVDVPRGEQRTLLLPDSSRVVVDAGSRLRYRADFRGWFGRRVTREVTLVGSAFFDVRRDGRPFRVATYNADVRVLGTAFAVSAWEGDRSGTAVDVAEGRVAVTGRARGETILAAGERATVVHGRDEAGPAAAVAVERVAPWRTGGFAAIDEPLGVVLAAVARRYDVEVTLADPGAAARRVTLYFPQATAERVLGDLATMQQLSLERRRDGYVLR